MSEWEVKQHHAGMVADMADQIRGIMKERGIRQYELAERMGVSGSRVSQILAGDSNPTLQTLAAIAVALGQDVKIRFYDL